MQAKSISYKNLAMFIILLLLSMINTNAIALNSSYPKKIVIFVEIQNINSLANQLSEIRVKITQIDQPSKPIDNIFHFSIRHLIGHPYTEKDFRNLENQVRTVAGKFRPFTFSTDTAMKIDEDGDVGLEYFPQNQIFSKLTQAVLAIPAPGFSKTYPPHSTVYYQVHNIPAVKAFLKNTHMDPRKQYTATAIGIGVLGSYNNLIAVKKIFALKRNLT